jgi:UDP-N-acetylglucosamine acyltransferase
MTCVIGPYTIIGDHVTIGAGTRIMSHVVIDPYVEIGTNCRIFQYRRHRRPAPIVEVQGEKTWLKIGNGCTIREFVTIHRGTEFGGGLTQIGDNCFPDGLHPHRPRLHRRRNVVMANNATLAGHITIGDHATIGGLVADPPIRAGGRIRLCGRQIRRGQGHPALCDCRRRPRHPSRPEPGGAQAARFLAGHHIPTKKTYRLIFRFGLTLNEAIERVAAEVEPAAEVQRFIAFIKASQRGITR